MILKKNSQQTRSSSVMSTKLPQPVVQSIKLHKNANGMGLSIVAAKGAGQVCHFNISSLLAEYSKK